VTGPFLVAGAPLVAHATTVWWKVGLYFLKVGAVIYGGGFVLLKFLEGDLVRSPTLHNYGWLTPKEMVDAIAVGQVTPGPVFSTATFIGYKVTVVPGHPWSGVPGAAVATIAIFLPSFILVVILRNLIGRLRTWMWTALFLDAINVSAVALMAAVLAKLAEQTLLVGHHFAWNAQPEWGALVIALVAAGVLLATKVPPIAVVLTAAVVGWLVKAA
jgi:chromate transporter